PPGGGTSWAVALPRADGSVSGARHRRNAGTTRAAGARTDQRAHCVAATVDEGHRPARRVFVFLGYWSTRPRAGPPPDAIGQTLGFARNEYSAPGRCARHRNGGLRSQRVDGRGAGGDSISARLSWRSPSCAIRRRCTSLRVRLKTDDDWWSNDSTWMQFFRLDVRTRNQTLEECSNCGVSARAREDDGAQ